MALFCPFVPVAVPAASARTLSSFAAPSQSRNRHLVSLDDTVDSLVVLAAFAGYADRADLAISHVVKSSRGFLADNSEGLQRRLPCGSTSRSVRRVNAAGG